MILISEKSGNCPGVKKLLEEIYTIYEREIVKDAPKKICILKNLINNSLIVEELSELGIEFIDNFDNLSQDDIIFLNTYFVSNIDLEKLKNNNIEYFDCSCHDLVDVRKVDFANCRFNTGNCPYLKEKLAEILKLANICDAFFLIGKKDDTESIQKAIQKYCPCYVLENFSDLKKVIVENNFNLQAQIGLGGGIEIPQKELEKYQALGNFWLFYQAKVKELKKGQDNINASLIESVDNDIIQKVINDFQDLNQDGKYLRGVLIAMGKYLTDYQIDQEYLDLAYAYEMFQTSILIHDDIIDNARLRRGKETIPRRICHEYLNQSNDKDYNNDVLRLANSIAICAGDYGFFNASLLISKSYSKYASYPKLMEYFNQIVIKTIKGEILDVYLPFLEKYELYNVGEDDILNIYHLKTSWYTLIGPFFLGFILGNKKINLYLEDILNKMGLIYQLKDDILGIFGNNQIIGKSNLSDIAEFKQTLLYTHVINTSYSAEFLKIYGNKIVKNSDLLKLRKILKDSGTLEYVNFYLQKLSNEVYTAIDELDLKDEGKSLLQGLLIYLINREK